MTIRNIDSEMKTTLLEDDNIKKAMDQKDEALELTLQEESEAMQGDPDEPTVKGLSGRELYELQTQGLIWRKYVAWLDYEIKMTYEQDLDNDDSLKTAKAKGKVIGLRLAKSFPQEAIQMLLDKQREGVENA